MGSDSNSRSAIVVGAGLAGLAAAYRLQQGGFDVTVLERNDRVGGRVLTQRRNGYVIDAGPDAMHEGYRNYRALAKELGLGATFCRSSAVVGLIRDGNVIDIDTDRTASMLFTPALSWRAKLCFLRGIIRHRKLIKRIDSSRLTDAADFDSFDENAQAFARREFGRECTDYLIDPLVRLVVGSGAAQASRLSVLGGLANWSAQLFNIRGGLDMLPNALATQLRVRTGTEVEQLSETVQGVEVRCRDANHECKTLSADVSVISATYDVAERIYPALLGYADDYATQLSYLPLVSVSLAYSALTRSKAYVIQSPTVEIADALLLFLQHNKAPDRAPPGHSLITIYTDGLATPRYLEQSDEQTTAWARQETERLFPELAGHFEFSGVTRWPVAGYLATPGFWRRTRALLAGLPETGRVQLAGDLFGAGSMESAVTWGEIAARRLIEHHGGALLDPPA